MMNSTEIKQLLDTSKEAENYEFFYSTYLYLMLTLSSFPISIIYFLYRHRFTRLNAEFRPIMVHAICTSAFLMLIVSIWQPVAMSPLFGGYSLGIFGWIGPDSFLFGLWLTWTCFAHLGVTFTVAFVLQSYQLKLFGEKIAAFEWLNTDGNSLKFLNGSFLFHAVLMMVPWVSLRKDVIDLSKIPELKEFVKKYPSAMLVPIRNNYVFIFFCGMAVFFICTEMICCLLANIGIFRAIRSTSKFVQAKTLQMQMQLYRLLSFQLLVVLIVFYAPIALIALDIQQTNYYIQTPKFVGLCICIMCWHCPIQLVISFIRFPSIRRASSAISPAPATNTKDNLKP